MSLEDLFQKKLCVCNHSIEEEHFNGVCYALDFNGTIYSACDCRHIKIKPLIIRASYEVSNTSTNKTIQKRPAKPLKPISTFNWGGSRKNSSTRT